MKKLILTAIAATCAVSVFAQGTIVFNNLLSGKVITHVYAPLTASPSTSQIGNASSVDFPVGSTSWAGYSAIGAAGNAYTGGGTFAELYAAQGQGVLEASLQPAYSGGVTSFRSGASAGFLYGKTPTFNNIAPDFAGGATAEMFAWDNRSGLYPTWASARNAWLGGLIAAGSSGVFNITAAVGGTGTPPNPLGLRSFNLYFIPEPSSFALAGLGAAALMIFRRRK
jgi:hypothetical protein